MMITHKFNRRALLQGAAATGGAAVIAGAFKDNFSAAPLEAPAEPGQGKSEPGHPRCIDVHHHVLQPEYVKEIGGSVIGAPAGRPGAPPWSVASSLEVMDRVGIETAVTSVSAPGFPLNDPKAVQRLVRTCNLFSK
jgi:hypothetical protein